MPCLMYRSFPCVGISDGALKESELRVPVIVVELEDMVSETENS